MDNEMSPPITRTRRCISFKSDKNTHNFATLQCIQTLSLTQPRPKSSSLKRLSVDDIIDYLLQIMEKLYGTDTIGFKKSTIEYLRCESGKIRPRLQQRLLFIKYLEQTLKYKILSEIDIEIQKEWHKNMLLRALTTIWASMMLLHNFQSPHQFIQEYQKQRKFVANLTNYYFKTALQIHQIKGTAFEFIFQDTSHQIINTIPNWKQIYQEKFIPLLIPKKGTSNPTINLDYDIKSLDINKQYIDLNENTNQLQKTTKMIQLFILEYRIHQRINLLKQIRTTFLTQIEENYKRIASKQKFTSTKMLEKDDIIGCMIYCIIKGQFSQLPTSLKAFSLLLGNKSQLLNKKGADCCQADLESAVQHLQQEQLNSPLIIFSKQKVSTVL